MLETDGGVYQLNENIVLRECEEPGKYWAFDTYGGDHYNLNQTSFWILSKLDGQSGLDQIFSAFIENYDVNSEQGKQDFGEIIATFISEGLIIRRNDESDHQAGL